MDVVPHTTIVRDFRRDGEFEWEQERGGAAQIALEAGEQAPDDVGGSGRRRERHRQRAGSAVAGAYCARPPCCQ